MKVIIDGKENSFISIFRPSGGNGGYCSHFQCNTVNNASAHSFNYHPSEMPKDQEIKTNGHVYIFPSK